MRASRDGRLRVLSRKFLKTLRRADENSQRAATMTFTGKKFHQRGKEMGSWGLRVSRLCFGSILNLEMSSGLFLIHHLGGKRWKIFGGSRGFLGERWGIIPPHGYAGRTIESDLQRSKEYHKALLGGGGNKVNFIVTHPKSSDPLSFPTLLLRNDWSIRFVDDNK